MSGSDGDTKGTKSMKMVDGDWTCTDSDCKNLNFARRTQCNRCGKERVLDSLSRKKFGTEIGKAAADKSRGLFSAEDWQCSKCANVNWARRHTCNMCNAPKFTDVEERTGYGGGYNDRGVVEYKERADDSEGEYDEFGRRKKLRNANSSSSGKQSTERKTEPTRNRKPANASEQEGAQKEDDDDEDEDEDEDGDLSKYDLWGDADETEEKSGKSDSGNKSDRKNSPKQSGSRSKSRSTYSRSNSSSSRSTSRTSRSSSRSYKKRPSRKSRSRSRSYSRSSRELSARSNHSNRNTSRKSSPSSSRRKGGQRSRSRSHGRSRR